MHVLLADRGVGQKIPTVAVTSIIRYFAVKVKGYVWKRAT